MWLPGRSALVPLLKWCLSLKRLHWSNEVVDTGLGAVPYVELVILCEFRSGERLRLEKAVPRNGRPISASVAPVGPGMEIWQTCRFL